MSGDEQTAAPRIEGRVRLDADAPPPDKAMIPKLPLWMKFGMAVRPAVDRAISRSSTVGDRPVHDPRDFPWVAGFEARWREIRAEAAAALADLDAVPSLAEVSPDHRRIAPAGRWRSYFLQGYGYRVAENCRRCPVTASLLPTVPGLNTAMFSVLVPHTHLPAHTGVTKAILVCHLGIQVPADRERCRMRVADQLLHWDEGRALVFDDVYNHEVWNDTDETRVVLLLQFRRPAGIVGRTLSRLFLGGVRRSRFVQDAKRGVERWAEQGGH